MRPLTRLLSSQLFRAFLSVSFLALLSQSGRADDLNFFQNYFVTGGSLTNGVGLATAKSGQGTINMTGANAVPCRSGGNPPYTFPVNCSTANAVPADVVAAYMYWQVVVDPTKTPPPTTIPPYDPPGSAAFGYFDGNAIRGALLGTDSTSKCWSNATNQALRVYRADIRRFLPIQQVGNTDPNKSIGVRVINGSHTVRFGYDNSTPTPKILPGVLFPQGASIVVVYRVFVPGSPLVAPLQAVVIYDGVHTISKANPNFTLNVGGFYQANDDGTPTMTNITGGGTSSTTAVLRVNGSNVGPHDFSGAAGANWDDATIPVDVEPNDSSYLIQVQSTNNNTCLTWGAVVSTIPVTDSDNDGLLDVWETKGFHENTTVSPATFGGCSDYPADPCVNFPAMGAKNGVRDLFIQFDWMHQTKPYQGSGGTDGLGSHDHMPKPDALQSVCQTYAANFIAAHFDVGNNYQGQPCIINKTYAQGGHDDDEANFICPTPGLTPPPAGCTYKENYAVLSWKGGFDSVVDGHPTTTPPTPPHFAHNRRHSFHEVLMAHALSGPFCPSNGQNPFGGTCTPNAALNADPKSISGIADRPGGDVMISFGLWGNTNGPDDKVGTSLQQAGTILHEVGHNLGLFHGGVTRENCMPNYFSSMSYLFQTRGLDDSSGNSHIGYSYGLSFPLNEGALSSTFPISLFMQYKPRFYAPLNSKNTSNQAAGSHCDGTPITDGALMILSEGATVGTPDWSNGNLKLPFSNYASDVNFNGVHGETFFDAGDWFVLNLQQVSARLMLGGLSTDDGLSDGGLSDGGLSDGGLSDGGLSDGGLSDGGLSDGGLSDGGLSDGGLSDGGLSDGGLSDGGIGNNDLDAVTVVQSGAADPPANLTVVQELNDIAVGVTHPSVVVSGATVSYKVYRCSTAACDPAGTAPILTFSHATPHNGGSCTFTDNAPCFADIVNDTNPYHSGATCPAGNTCYDTTYTYKIITEQAFKDNLGNPAVSDGAYSNPGSGEVMHLFVIANSQGHITYGAANPTPTSTTYGDGGTVAGVTCAYYPSGTPGTLPLPASVTPRNAGTYAILCTSTATNGSGGANVGVSFNVTYLTNVPGTLIIDQRHISVTAAAANKVYDGGTTCAIGTCTSGPTITTGSLAYASPTTSPACPVDTLAFTETFDNKNVLSPQNTHVMTPAGIVNDCNSGANYAYDSFNTIGTGTITPAPLQITASSAVATYGDAVPAITPGYIAFVSGEGSGVLTPGPSCVTTYTKGSPVSGSPYPTSCSGAADANYNISYVNGTVTVNQASLAITASSTTVTFGDGVPTITAGYNAFVNGEGSGELNPGPTCTTTYTQGSPVAGSPYSTSCSLAADANYNISYVNGTVTVNRASSTTTVTCPPGPYTFNGSPQTPCSVTVTGAGGLSLSSPGITPTYSNNTNAGTLTATASYTYAPDGNHTGSNNSASFTILQAPVTATAGTLSGIYTGSPQSPSACTVTGTAPATFTGGLTCTNNLLSVGPGVGSGVVTPVVSNANFLITFANGAWTIGPATATISVTPYNVSYDGSAHTASGSATGVDGANLNADLNFTNTTHTNPGTYSTDSWTFSDPNYFSVGPTTITDTITTAYTSDPNLANFTTVNTYAQFLASPDLVSDKSGMDMPLAFSYTPAAADVAAGYRVYPPKGGAVVVDFGAGNAFSKIRVFPNIDHYGAAYDGYQYSISGSNDGITYFPLFDVISVNGVGEPFTLGTFNGTAPLTVNNVLTPGAGPGGTVGYIADFSFSTAYRFYSFGTSLEATSNTEQELTAVAALP